MRFSISKNGTEHLLAGTAGEPPSGRALLHSIDGWYDRSVDISTENKIFTGGDVITKLTHKGKEIIVNISLTWEGLGDTNETAWKALDYTGESLDYVKIEFEQSDRGRWAGDWEQYNNAVMTDYKVVSLGVSFAVVDLTFFLPDPISIRE